MDARNIFCEKLNNIRLTLSAGCCFIHALGQFVLEIKRKKLMKKLEKPFVGLAFGLVLLGGLQCQTSQAQPIVLLPLTPGGQADTGTSVLADALGSNSGPEAITVYWSVNESSNHVFTYSYQISNAVGDVVLDNSGHPTSTPEIVDAFSVGFDTTQPGAYIMNSQQGGLYDANNGSAGLFWAFAGINPGTVSGPMSFQSDLPPVLGNANAQDRNPPSPWSSNPNGQPVPVPGAVPEPPATILLALASLLLPFRSRLSQFIRKGEKVRSS